MNCGHLYKNIEFGYDGQWLDCQSTNIDHCRYARETSTLYIRFMSGHVYAYDGVSYEVFVCFAKAASLGTFLNCYIKPNHPARKV